MPVIIEEEMMKVTAFELGLLDAAKITGECGLVVFRKENAGGRSRGIPASSMSATSQRLLP